MSTEKWVYNIKTWLCAQIENQVCGSLGRNSDVSDWRVKAHYNVIFCVLTFCSRLMGGATDDACLFMCVSVEQPVERQKCVLQ